MYQTWIKFGTKLCDAVSKKLDEAMDKLEEMDTLWQEYKDEYKKIPADSKANWDFMDYEPVFKELLKVVLGNIKQMRDGLSSATKLSKEKISSTIT